MKMENIFYPLVPRIAAQPTAQTSTAPEALSTAQLVAKAPVATQPAAKGHTITQHIDAGTTKISSELTKALAKEKRVSKGKEVKHSKPSPTAKNDPLPFTGSQDIGLFFVVVVVGFILFIFIFIKAQFNEKLQFLPSVCYLSVIYIGNGLLFDMTKF